MSVANSQAAIRVVRSAISALERPLSSVDLSSGWTDELRQTMVRWFAEMLQRLQRNESLRGDYMKIARELDYSGVREGRLFDLCGNAQRQLGDILGRDD